MTQSDDLNSNADSAAVLRSWRQNAAPWTAAVRQAKIPSRTLVTNQAIIDAIVERTPQRVLDLGCGEGWLSWHLSSLGMHVVGVDAVAALIKAAQNPPSHSSLAPEFRELAYDEVKQALSGESFDLIVCNFSLLDRDGVSNLMRAIPALLSPKGELLIQTLHPDFIGTPESRRDGWRSESWQGMGDEFRGHAPWYFRTMASWQQLFLASGLQLQNLIEPIHPETALPASVIFALRASN